MLPALGVGIMRYRRYNKKSHQPLPCGLERVCTSRYGLDLSRVYNYICRV